MNPPNLNLCMSNFPRNLNLCFLFALLNKYLNIFEFCKDDLVQLATTELKESWRFSVLILVWVVIECRTGHPVFDESLYPVIDACDYKQDWPPCDRASMVLRFRTSSPCSISWLLTKWWIWMVEMGNV